MHDPVELRQAIARVTLAVTALSACWVGCDKKETAAPAVLDAASPPLCSGPVDPPRAAMREAIDAFRDQNYEAAQLALDVLAKQYPTSATVRVWRGDATLFDKKLNEATAAERALPFFLEAQRLFDAGCPLRDREQYYMRMGLVYGYLRRDDPRPALTELEALRQRWPDSAEVTYHMARAHCLLGQVERCAELFEQTLEIAQSLRRPIFLRTHHSVDDWVRRSRTQSEFPALRKLPRYEQAVARATAPSPSPSPSP